MRHDDEIHWRNPHITKVINAEAKEVKERRECIVRNEHLSGTVRTLYKQNPKSITPAETHSGVRRV